MEITFFVENNEYKFNDKPLAGKNLELFKSFLGQFLPSKKNPLGQSFTKNISNVELVFKSKPLIVKNNSLYINDSIQLGPSNFKLLHYLAENVNLGRVDMVALGTLGEDYSIWYKGEELVMNQRKLKRKKWKASVKL